MSLVQRMLRAAKLDVNLYEEVEADKGATGQALLVVVLTSVAAGIGNISSGGITGLLSGTVFGIVSWVVWAYANYLLGAKLFKEPQTEANWGQLARTMGFASAPRIIMVRDCSPSLCFGAWSSWSPPSGCGLPWSSPSGRRWTTRARGGQSA